MSIAPESSVFCASLRPGGATTERQFSSSTLTPPSFSVGASGAFARRLLALTPISPFRPRRWRGAILPAVTEVRFEILDHYKRPVSATADSHEVRDVVEVGIRESSEQTMTLLFDPEHNLEERSLNEQFEL